MLPPRSTSRAAQQLANPAAPSLPSLRFSQQSRAQYPRPPKASPLSDDPPSLPPNSANSPPHTADSFPHPPRARSAAGTSRHSPATSPLHFAAIACHSRTAAHIAGFRDRAAKNPHPATRFASPDRTDKPFPPPVQTPPS